MFSDPARGDDADGQGDEIAETARNISSIAPEVPPDPTDDTD